MIARSQVHRITETGMFFEKTGPVWETLRALERRLEDAGIDYVVIGGLALNVYGYARQTVDVDIVVTTAGYTKFKEQFAGSVYMQDEVLPRRFIDPDSEVAVDLVISGEIAGHKSKNRSVRFPDPADAELHEDVRTVSFARLIELKLVTWRYKDWGDVVELIRQNNLPEAFADQLDSVVRGAYAQCYDQAYDEEYEAP